MMTSDKLDAVNHTSRILMGDMKGPGRQHLDLLRHVRATSFQIINLVTKQRIDKYV